MLTDINDLNQEEIKRFEDFINSPYFNKYETIIDLFYYLKGYYPRISTENVSAQQLSRYLYGHQTDTGDRVRKLESDFNRLLEKFLLLEQTGKGKVDSGISLLIALRERRLFDSYKKKLNEIQKYSRQDFGDDEKYYMNKLNYYDELFTSTFSIFNKENPTYAVKKITYLNLFFIYQSLVYNHNFNSLNLYKDKVKQKPISLINDVFRFIQQNLKNFSNEHYDIVMIYYANIMMMTKELKYFRSFQNFYNRKKRNFDTNLKTLYYFITSDFLEFRLNTEPSKTNRLKLFKIKAKMLLEGHYHLYYQGREINAHHYFHTFNQAVNLKRFDWAEKYANELKRFLPTKDRDNVYNMIQLILNFFRKEYADIFTMLNNVNKQITTQYIYSRYIKMMMLFYEAENPETLRYEIQAMRKYLARIKKFKPYEDKEIERAHVFISSINFLIKFRDGKYNLQSKKFLQFKSRLNADKFIAAYPFWFEEKLKELERRILKNRN